jgi:hypothetical protein
MKAISIRQPWASLIVAGYKTIENRTWDTGYRGPLLIHAGKRWDTDWESSRRVVLDHIHCIKETLGELPVGGIIGRVDLVHVIEASSDPYWIGPFGFVLARPIALPFKPWTGRLQLFDVPSAAIRR